jgi:hypothetical protein
VNPEILKSVARFPVLTKPRLLIMRDQERLEMVDNQNPSLSGPAFQAFLLAHLSQATVVFVRHL